MPKQGEPGCCGSPVVMKRNAKHRLLHAAAGSPAGKRYFTDVYVGI